MDKRLTEANSAAEVRMRRLLAVEKQGGPARTVMPGGERRGKRGARIGRIPVRKVEKI